MKESIKFKVEDNGLDTIALDEIRLKRIIKALKKEENKK